MGIGPFFSYKNASKYSNVVFVACSGGAIQKGSVFINKNAHYKYAANATLMLFGFDYWIEIDGRQYGIGVSDPVVWKLRRAEVGSAVTEGSLSLGVLSANAWENAGEVLPNNITEQIAPHVMRLASFLNLLFRFIRDISNKKTLCESVVYNLLPCTIKQYKHHSCYKKWWNISYKIQKRHASQYKTCPVCIM